METAIKTDIFTIAAKLAESIATFNIPEITDLLSETGEYTIQDDKDEIVKADKATFLNWLTICMDEFLYVNDESNKLNYIIDRCIHCKIGNPVIIFEKGRFPVFTRDPWQREKCGLMLEFEGDIISGITFCFVFLKTENPYLFEKDCNKRLR